MRELGLPTLVSQDFLQEKEDRVRIERAAHIGLILLIMPFLLRVISNTLPMRKLP